MHGSVKKRPIPLPNKDESDSSSDNDTDGNRKSARKSSRARSPGSGARSVSAMGVQGQDNRAGPAAPEGPPSARRRSKSPLQRIVSEDALAVDKRSPAPDDALRMATQSVPINGPMQVQELCTALVDPQLAPKLLETIEFLVNAVSTMQEQMSQQQRILEFMCGELGTKLGFPALSKYPVAATPVTDGRQIPGPKDANPRAMTYEEMWFLKHHMDAKQKLQPSYAKMVMRILSPTDWYIEGFRLKPRLDLAEASTLWKLWYLTHDCYKYNTLQSVLTADEMRASEAPSNKKTKKAKALTHATAALDSNKQLQSVAQQASAEADCHGKELQQQARKPDAAGPSAAGRFSPCACAPGEDVEDDECVDERQLFGSSEDEKE